MEVPTYTLTPLGHRQVERSEQNGPMYRIALGQLLIVVDLYGTPPAMRTALVETASLDGRDAAIVDLHYELANSLDAALTIAVARGLVTKN